jgi:hypothetical protein
MLTYLLPIIMEPCQPKISDSQFAVARDQQIAWFKISVKDADIVHGLDTLQELLREALEVQVTQWLLRAENVMKIAVH